MGTEKISVTLLINLLPLILGQMGNMDKIAVSLNPSPVAVVDVGETLDVHCHCNATHAPDFVSWYLNGDKAGLVLDASNCRYHGNRQVYEIHRYKLSCNKKNFTLSIFNISYSKDNNDTWECDIAIRDVFPPSKALTTIMVNNIDERNGNGGGIDDPSRRETIVPITVGILSGLVLMMIISATVLMRRWKNDGGRNRCFQLDTSTGPPESQMPLNCKEARSSKV